MKIGMGYDVHQLVDGRKLVLGGETIVYEKGLLGHSDADVLVHAVCDALLGAAGLGDIGQHFPDTSPDYKDVYSLDLLVRTNEMINSKGLRLVNLDTTVLAQAPKLAPYKSKMEKNLARALKIDPKRINIKATTTEGLGPVGRKEGIAAMCVVLLEESS
jgi:2-C-methyl-D-erythritol 2,4-cyclodiphosphate synthase